MTKPLTIKQERVVKGVLADTSNTKKEIMRNAGYSEGIAKQPSVVLESKPVKKALKSHRDLFEAEMLKALKEADKKRGTAKYNHLIEATDKLKKQINVIDGVIDEKQSNIIVIPESFMRKSKTIEGEIIPPDMLTE